jgi:large subunit ribosomal protein L29
MKTSEIREFTDKEIEERVDSEQTRLTQLKLNHAVSPLDNPMKIREAQKNIARLKTEINQRLKKASPSDKNQ